MVIWIIGLSGAGKTAVSSALRERIVELGKACVLIDGDVIREVYGNDLTHSIADRKKNADRVGRLCQFLDTQGVNVVCAILSIFPESQEWNRKNIKNYFEIFLDADITEVKKRDTKGLYSRAERGEICEVVGVDIPFPRPKAPDLVLMNDFSQPVNNLSEAILTKVRNRLI